jgi:glycosyltransferase involved in cell wall biosynthesis
MDDGSTDDTAAICDSLPNTAVYLTPFQGLNEARDKCWLLEQIMKRTVKPDWILSCDGDEVLRPESVSAIKESLYTPKQCMSFKVKYLWDREDQVRVDGVYGDFRRQSMFRPISGAKFLGHAPGFHCGNVPQALWKSCIYPDVELLHLGYLHREDRIRKYEWYNQQDPGNKQENFYRHMVIGDLFSPDSRFQHGGPLKLQPLT